MFTRRNIDYFPRVIAPFYPPQTGYPGYWSQRCGMGHTMLRLGRGPMSEIAVGFGYAKDPSDPTTWRHQPTVFT